MTDGRVLGHEGIGVVEQVGTGVSEFHIGDKVIISCVTACLKCEFCRRGMYSHCRHGGWILGNTIDGTQAEYVRTPHADGSLYNFPPGGDEEAMVMVSDILPTGFECGVLKGQVKPGDAVAIVGAGPVGLAVLLTAQFYSPAAILTGQHHILGVGRLIKLDTGNEGEVAIPVSDRYQKHGLGTELLRRVVQIARDQKLCRLSGELLRDNLIIQIMVKRLGFALTFALIPHRSPPLLKCDYRH